MNNTVQQRIRQQSVDQREEQFARSRERFMERLAQRKPIESAPSLSLGEALEREKKLRKRAQKQAISVQKNLDKQKKNVAKQNQLIKELEEKLANLERERYETNQKLVTIEKQVDETKVTLEKRLKIEVEQRKIAEESLENTAVQRKQNNGGRKKINLSNQIKQLKESNTTLRKQVEHHNLLAKEKYGNMEQELKSLRREVHTYRNREKKIKEEPMKLVDYMKHHFSSDHIPALLAILQNHIATDSLPYFYRGEHNIFYLMMRRVNLLRYHEQKRRTAYKLKKKVNSNNKTRLGYLMFEKDCWCFVDITETDTPKVYDVLENISGEELFIDRPVKANLLPNGGVCVKKCLSMENTRPIPTQHSTKNKKPHAAKKEFLEFGNFNVLVVGSRFLNEYKERLEKHGCKADAHNPFEESYEQLAGKVSRAEVIIVCGRHIPHSVWDHIDKKQPFVSILAQDSRDLVSTYTYVTLQRCELI